MQLFLHGYYDKKTFKSWNKPFIIEFHKLLVNFEKSYYEEWKT